MKLLAHLLSDLKSIGEGGESLLDRSMVLYGSNLGDANAHVCTNMPVIFAGVEKLSLATLFRRRHPSKPVLVSAEPPAEPASARVVNG